MMENRIKLECEIERLAVVEGDYLKNCQLIDDLKTEISSLRKFPDTIKIDLCKNSKDMELLKNQMDILKTNLWTEKEQVAEFRMELKRSTSDIHDLNGKKECTKTEEEILKEMKEKNATEIKIRKRLGKESMAPNFEKEQIDEIGKDEIGKDESSVEVLDMECRISVRELDGGRAQQPCPISLLKLKISSLEKELADKSEKLKMTLEGEKMCERQFEFLKKEIDEMRYEREKWETRRDEWELEKEMEKSLKDQMREVQTDLVSERIREEFMETREDKLRVRENKPAEHDIRVVMKEVLNRDGLFYLSSDNVRRGQG